MKRTRSTWRRLPTEAERSASRPLDTLRASAIAAMMIDDAVGAIAAVKRERSTLAAVIDVAARAFRSGGRWIFVGAGTSGRLGVLEAAELPPTFGISSTRAIGVMAGGRGAITRAREGVEDDGRAGTRAIRRLRLRSRDLVIAISASGVTPFVHAALAEAGRAGAATVAVTCDPKSPLRRLARMTVVLRTGPEVVAGSTRLKAGTATKIALNIITTSAMIRCGKTYDNLMVDVRITSRKLRDRATRILSRVTGLSPLRAARLLDRADGHVKTAVVMHTQGVDRIHAGRLLRAADGSLRRALERPRR